MCTYPGDPGQPVGLAPHAPRPRRYMRTPRTSMTSRCRPHFLRPARSRWSPSSSPCTTSPRTGGPRRCIPAATWRGHQKSFWWRCQDGELHLGIKEVRLGPSQAARQVDESSAVLCTVACGDCVGAERPLRRVQVIMDSRLLHCGTANSSELPRGCIEARIGAREASIPLLHLLDASRQEATSRASLPTVGHLGPGAPQTRSCRSTRTRRWRIRVRNGILEALI